MILFENTVRRLAFFAAVCALTGCQDDPAKQGGTYTAARHMSTGSNIPQRSDVANTSSVYAPPRDTNGIGGNGAVGAVGGR